MGLSEADYARAAPNAKFVDNEETYRKQIVIALRYPGDGAVRRMLPESCLVSMLHYPTRPTRITYLKSLGIEAISMDSVTDDVGRRLIENLQAVGWNGLRVAFETLRKIYPPPGMDDPKRNPIKVTVMGAGAVGMHAIQAAIRYGDESVWRKMAGIGATGVQVTAVDYDLTNHPDIMRKIVMYTDILVDATQRRDTSRPVIPNEVIGLMRPHAVLVDLSVDPYDFSTTPPSVKGIEGIPQGNLDQYIFSPDDPIYAAFPSSVNTTHRRHAISCYSWPGIYPYECMQVYSRQLRAILRTLVETGGPQNISLAGTFFHRAIHRALLSQWNADTP